MARRRVLLVAVVLVAGCSDAGAGDGAHDDPGVGTAPAGDVDAVDRPDACDWVTDETVALAIGGAPTAPPEPTAPAEPTDVGVRGCAWRSATAELTVLFRRFHCCARSVEAELIRVREGGGDQLVTVEGLRGAFVRPGGWYGETPLDQYGMAEIDLAHLDGGDPDAQDFASVVDAILGDVVAADPDVPS